MCASSAALPMMLLVHSADHVCSADGHRDLAGASRHLGVDSITANIKVFGRDLATQKYGNLRQKI